MEMACGGCWVLRFGEEVWERNRKGLGGGREEVDRSVAM